jgi:hypothetical protein
MHRPWLGALVLLVMVLHWVGLQTLSSSLVWRPLSEPHVVAHVRLAAPEPAPAPAELIPLPAPVKTSAPQVAKVVATGQADISPQPHMDVNAKPAQASPPQSEEKLSPTVPEPVVATNPTTAPPLPAVVETPVAPEPAATAAARPSVSTPLSWLSKAHFVWPAPTLLQFDLSGTSKGVRYNANANISWKHQDNSYQLRHDIQAFLFGNRSQTSTGQLGATGLLPTRFGDQFRQEQAAHFDRAKGLLIYSANTPSQAIEEGAQDRVSLFVQLAAAMAGTPDLRNLGQTLSFQVVSAKQAEVWTFAVLGNEKITTPLGDLDSLKMHRVPRNEYDQKIDMWLSPAHGYLPARLRITQANGDVIEETLKSAGKP